jgi:CBS domain-containing protein
MKKREAVSQIMTENLLSVQGNQTLKDVIEIVRKNHVRHVPVLEGSKIVGIISTTDINRLTFGALFENQDGIDESIINMLSIEQVMTRNPRTVNVSDSIKEVAEVLAEADYHSLPVEEDGEVVGIVTTTDLLRYYLKQY